MFIKKRLEIIWAANSWIEIFKRRQPTLKSVLIGPKVYNFRRFSMLTLFHSLLQCYIIHSQSQSWPIHISLIHVVLLNLIFYIVYSSLSTKAYEIYVNVRKHFGKRLKTYIQNTKYNSKVKCSFSLLTSFCKKNANG